MRSSVTSLRSQQAMLTSTRCKLEKRIQELKQYHDFVQHQASVYNWYLSEVCHRLLPVFKHLRHQWPLDSQNLTLEDGKDVFEFIQKLSRQTTPTEAPTNLMDVDPTA